jgi:hypothetical protein
MIDSLRPSLVMMMACAMAAGALSAWPHPARAAGPDDQRSIERPAEPGIDIHSTRTSLRDEVYYLDAAIEYRFGKAIEEALPKGVAIPIIVGIEIERERSYMWNETIASLEQRYALEYHALSRQYIVRNVNIGTQSAYPSLDAAIAALGEINHLPLIDVNLLTPGETYIGRLQARIDINQLPVPLRLLAVVSPEWRLSSEWYEWRF